MGKGWRRGLVLVSLLALLALFVAACGGGSVTNDRFSTLGEINTENVSQLKGDYVTKIGSEATAAKFSAEGQALEYEGTIYIPDGGDHVYAMEASTGKVLWTYEPHLPPDPLGEV